MSGKLAGMSGAAVGCCVVLTCLSPSPCAHCAPPAQQNLRRGKTVTPPACFRELPDNIFIAVAAAVLRVHLGRDGVADVLEHVHFRDLMPARILSDHRPTPRTGNVRTRHDYKRRRQQRPVRTKTCTNKQLCEQWPQTAARAIANLSDETLTEDSKRDQTVVRETTTRVGLSAGRRAELPRFGDCCNT